MNIQPIDSVSLARQLLLFCLTISYGLVLRVAHDWYPFTPTYTSVERKWFGLRDVLRWALSGMLLFIVPFSYFGVVMVWISKHPVSLPLSFPSLRETINIVALLCLGIPFLGFYDIWQAIVRSAPSIFYSPEARATIEAKFASAFNGGRIATFFLGLVWLAFPLVLYHVVTKP